jgi:hypothetical protein
MRATNQEESSMATNHIRKSRFSVPQTSNEALRARTVAQAAPAESCRTAISDYYREANWDDADDDYADSDESQLHRARIPRNHRESIMATTDTFRECDTNQIVQQIGRMTIGAISGLRVIRRPTGITLPVSSGYSVTVDLNWDDTYVVRRVFKRGAKVWVKGEQKDVYCDEVGEVAYRASCFRNGPWGQS